MKFPFRVVRYEFRQDSGGVGEFRGGLGLDREFELLEDVMITTSLERSKCPPWGLNGGGSGESPLAKLAVPEGPVEEFRKATMKPVPAGSILTISTAGGGGYGLAAEREAESVLIDVTRGLVSVGLAAASYGVVVVETPNGLEIDTSATELLRQDIRQADIRHK